MNKYKIEGGIDFFEELYKSLDVEENEEKTDDDKNKCLITNQLLIDKHISLECGHKFNYVPLYNDILNHKKKFNYLEGNSGKLGTNEIRCPYCRKKQTGVLPYYEDLGLEKVNGVNLYDPSLKVNTNYSHGKKCEFKIINNTYDSSIPESAENFAYQLCGSYYSTPISIYNYENPQQPINYGDTKCYCYYHKKQVIKQHKLLEKEKKKEEEKLAKQKAKEEKKLEKELAKAKEKEEKQKAKKELKELKAKKTKVSDTENMVLGPVTIENETVSNLCNVILKSGPRKGLNCGCQVFADSVMCKRHHTLNNK